MPKYDARCPGCGAQIEIEKRMVSPWPYLVCSRCHAQLERVYQSVPVSYLSPGFLTSDNRSETEKFRFEHLWKD